MISRLLVANRAEIASRVFRTCRALGIETVAVHSDADAALPYVREADVAVRLPGNAPAETYLDVEAVLRRREADRCRRGPPRLRLPVRARRLRPRGRGRGADLGRARPRSRSRRWARRSRRSGSCATPAYRCWRRRTPPTEVDLPLIVKASAGGGGRGMRIVRRPRRRWRPRSSGPRREAASAFGDGTVFVEPYVEQGRHVEVQVVGDRHGDVLVLGDRDCSIQRRHQKVVEEAPAPDLDPEVARAMHDAARAAALAIGYVGAGTVEFLYDPATERFFFLEMNTRLQVEHPVTEEVFGVDLVALQLAVAEGASCAQDGPAPVPGTRRDRRARDRGPAVRRGPGARLPAAERGARRPSTSRSRTGIRVDAGFESGQRGVARTTTPCSPRWSATRRPAQQAARRLAGRAGPRPDPRRHHQPRPAGRDPARPGLPGGQGRHRLPRPHLGRRRERAGDPAPAAAGRGHRRPGRATGAPAASSSAGSRSAGATSSRSRRSRRSSRTSRSRGPAAATATWSTASRSVPSRGTR